MDVYSAGADVDVSVDLVDEDGAPIVAESVSYTVYSGNGTSIVTGTITVNGSEEELTVTVLAANNAVAVGSIHEARTVVFKVTTATNTYTLQHTYIIEEFTFLQIPEQSGVTLQDAHVLALSVGREVSEAWGMAEDRERQGALREAWERIARIRLCPWRPHESPDDTLSSDILNLDFRVNTLTSAEWMALPEHFRKACQRAQFVEANIILDGDPTWARRQDGLISKTVGESSEMFRSRKPIEGAVSPKATAEIREYIRRRVRVGR